MSFKPGRSVFLEAQRIAFKWIRIIYRCWKERAEYDEKVYLAALAKQKSPLLAATNITL